MTEVETLPLQREEDALLSIQNALALFTVIKRSPSHSSISTAPTVSASSSPSRSLRSNQRSCDDNSDDADSSEQTIGGIHMELAVTNSIAATLSSQEDTPEYERPERALKIISIGGINMEQAVTNSIAETLSSQYAPENERPEVVLAIKSISHIPDLSNVVEDEDEAAPSGSLLSQMFFTCMGGSVRSTSIEPQSTGQNQDKMKSESSTYSCFADASHSTMDNLFAFCGTLREPLSTALATTQRSSSKGRLPRRSCSRRSDNDDASRRTDRTDKTEKHRNTSKKKKLEKLMSKSNFENFLG